MALRQAKCIQASRLWQYSALHPMCLNVLPPLWSVAQIDHTDIKPINGLHFYFVSALQPFVHCA